MSELPKKSVYIVIPVHNRRAITVSCLQRLKALGILDCYSVVIVDDGSTDGTAAAIKKKFPSVALLYGDGNLWWTGAIKLGMEYAYSRACDLIIWLNDDCFVEKRETITSLVEAVQNSPDTIVGSLVLESANSSKVAFGGKRKNGFTYEMIKPSEPGIFNCDLLCGNLVCMSSKVIASIGYPNVEKCPHYGGDFLFLIRARQSGYSLFLDARYPAFDAMAQHTSQTNPDGWLTGDTPIYQIFSQIFQPQSLMSWKLWWTLFTVDYPEWGWFLFLKKFSKLFLLLSAIAALRLLPIKKRRQLSQIKRRLLSSH